ncbi:MAG TPA: hypothetical protein VKB34_08810 [Povalibacter sp.]|nr:hypothetical protein [Povalibacter sp.]
MAERHSLRFALLSIAALALGACGGQGDNDSAGNPPPPGTTVTLSGKITFDRIVFQTTLRTGLNPSSPVESPARQITVEALDASSGNTILATTTTDEAGNYTFQVPTNRMVRVRAKAEMAQTGSGGTWNFRVLDNTQSATLYVLDGDAADTGTANATRNLRATSGWGTTSYTGTRAAAPFAILDTVYSAKKQILDAVAGTAFPALNLYWSKDNRPTVANFCTTSGDIGTTFYTPGETAARVSNCAPSPNLPGIDLPAGIYVLGDFANGNGDTDEFDQHVIAHEFGHFVEDKFSRSDSIGGSHSIGDRLDLRVAFSEGWGNAYAGMVLNDPLYRDSALGVSADTGFDMEADNPNDGWFSELSITEILWDLFDNVADAGDQVALGFPPLYAVMVGAQRSTDAMTSIYTFVDGLRAANASQVAGINALLTGESITNTDAFGTNETNAGGSQTALPIYQDVAVNQPLPTPVCSSGNESLGNQLGYRRLLRLTLPTATAVTIRVDGTASGTFGVPATDPDIYLYTRGVIVAIADSTAAGVETITQQPLGAGVHIIEVYDYDVGVLPRCMSVAVSGL